MRTRDPLDGIAAFLSVASRMNFSQAATELGMSRQTVGAQIRQLEDRLGIRLLHRSTRKVTLTEAGSAYRDALSGVLPQIREAERAATSFHEETVGRLKISAPPDLGRIVIVKAVSEFIELNPAVAVDLDLSHRAVNLIGEGFDLAIRGRLAIEETLITRHLASSRIVLCASPDYLARSGKPAVPYDLAQHACLHFAEIRWGRVWIFRRDGEELRVPITPRCEVNDALSLRDMALFGSGVALLPSYLVVDDLAKGRLVQVLADWDTGTVPIHVVYPANRHIAIKVRRFVDFIAARVRALD